MHSSEVVNDFAEGQVLLFDKPVGWTSFDVVKKVRQLIKRKYNLQKIKVGHAGTLDPLASGLMVICTGKATKSIANMQLLEKEYLATLEFGKTTPSFDLETLFDGNYQYEQISHERLEKVLKSFEGEIEQVPPLYSAKHHQGERAYELARRGDKTSLKAHRVKIHEIRIVSFELPEVQLLIRCGKGTYIRSLVRDIGKACGSGAYLKSLQRTAIPPYLLNQSMSLENFEENFIKTVSK